MFHVSRAVPQHTVQPTRYADPPLLLMKTVVVSVSSYLQKSSRSLTLERMSYSAEVDDHISMANEFHEKKNCMILLFCSPYSTSNDNEYLAEGTGRNFANLLRERFDFCSYSMHLVRPCLSDCHSRSRRRVFDSLILGLWQAFTRPTPERLCLLPKSLTGYTQVLVSCV